MERVRVATLTATVVTALLMIGGGAKAGGPFENPELSDVRTLLFSNTTRSGFSYVMATMSGGYGVAYPRFHGYRFGWTRGGNFGLIVFDLYEPDDVKRQGAGNFQVKQSDFAQFAFWISTPGGGWSSADPTYSPVASLYSYYGWGPYNYPMWWIGSPYSPIAGCNASIKTKDRDRDGLPESATWKATCNSRSLSWLSPDDKKLFQKVLKGLKGTGHFPAFYSVYY